MGIHSDYMLLGSYYYFPALDALGQPELHPGTQFSKLFNLQQNYETFKFIKKIFGSRDNNEQC